jgi:hypothetical protein
MEANRNSGSNRVSYDIDDVAALASFPKSTAIFAITVVSIAPARPGIVAVARTGVIGTRVAGGPVCVSGLSVGSDLTSADQQEECAGDNELD